LKEERKLQFQLDQKKKRLEDVQQLQSENSSTSPQVFHSNLGLNDFSKKLEQFDSKQQEGKWSGGKIALVTISCLLGGGLIVFLL